MANVNPNSDNQMTEEDIFMLHNSDDEMTEKDVLMT